MTSLTESRRVLLLMGEPEPRRLYVRLLEQRGHRVFATSQLEEADRRFRSGELDLAVVDADIEQVDPSRWTDLQTAVPILLLYTPEESDDGEEVALHQSGCEQVHLALQKPLSPMEFGIQVDHLLGTPPTDHLEEDSEANRRFEEMQAEFVFRLDEQFSRLLSCWEDIAAAFDRPGRAVTRLRRAIGPLLSASRHYGFVELADDLEAFDNFVRPLAAPGYRLDGDDVDRGRELLESLRDACRRLQTAHRCSHAPADGQPDRPQTLLVVDADEDFLETVEGFGEQYMVRIRTATDVTEARRRVRTPLLTGVLLSVSRFETASALREAVARLRDASPLDPLPLALVGDGGESLDRVRSLWAGASVLVSKPLTASKFVHTTRRLARIRRAQKASILVIEPNGEFAEQLATHIDSRHVAVDVHNAPESLFENLEARDPDLLVLDAHIPVVSSFDVCRALRAIPRWQDLPIVMVDDRDQPELRLAAYEAGVDDFFSRRISAGELRARIRVRLKRAAVIRERTDRDALTGLLTRRAFLERLAARLSEATRHERTLVFALLDIDRFKTINDCHGHPTGDEVLKTLGRLLRQRFRVEDLRCRWGGEEFAVVLADEDATTARKALDRVREEFRGLTFTDDDGECFQVSFSAGIAEFPTDGYDAETLLAAADDRLLHAKQSGRNRIVVARS